MLDGGLAGRHRLVRILVAQLAQVEADALGDLHAARHRAGKAGEQPRHLGGGFRWRSALACQPQAGLVRSCSPRGCRSARPAAAGVRGRGRARRWWPPSARPSRSRQGRQLRQPRQVAGAIAPGRRQPDVGQARRRCASDHARRRASSRSGGTTSTSWPSAWSRKSAQCSSQSAFLARRWPSGEQAGEAAVGLAVGGIDQQAGRPVGEVQPAAGERAHRRSRPPAGRAPATTPAPRRPGCCGRRSPTASSPSASAPTTSSPGCDAPRRNEKLLAACSSA